MTQVTYFYDEEERWSLDLPETLDVVLQKGFKVEIDKSRITLPPPGRLAVLVQQILKLKPTPPDEPLKCQVVGWRYRVGATDADSRLEVKLRETKKP
jgi:hypothetical protein